MIVYSHKCVIRTVSSFRGNTTYFKDIIGVQFNKTGLSNGFLQLETASSNDNNSRNMADENTFAFESNEKIYEAYRYNQVSFLPVLLFVISKLLVK